MEEQIEFAKKRGALEGNQYARKLGFYSRKLSAEEHADFELATAVEGFDEEIDILLVKIKSLVEKDPDNIHLIMLAINSLSRLIYAKYNLRKDDKQIIKEAIGNVLKNIALPLGIGIGTAIKE
jgi:hypothetical protein